MLAFPRVFWRIYLWYSGAVASLDNAFDKDCCRLEFNSDAGRDAHKATQTIGVVSSERPSHPPVPDVLAVAPVRMSQLSDMPPCCNTSDRHAAVAFTVHSNSHTNEQCRRLVHFISWKHDHL